MEKLSHINKHLIVNIFAVIAMTLVVSYAPISLAEVNNASKLYTQEGYPYGPLVQRMDSVKIRYSELHNKQVQCSTELKNNAQIWTSEVRKVSEKKFNKAPLKACLKRDLARQILAGTFL
jgi:hypothetical protein